MAGYHLLVGPKRNVERGIESRYANIKENGTSALAAGAGTLDSVTVGVVGTLITFYDTAPGGTVDATTEIATMSLAALGASFHGPPLAFDKGLTAVTTGSGSVCVGFTGRNGSTSQVVRTAP